MTEQIKNDIAALERLMATASPEPFDERDVAIEVLRSLSAIERIIAALKAQTAPHKESEADLLDMEIEEAQTAYDKNPGSIEAHRRLVCLQEEKKAMSVNNKET